jgi:hypothetical protein
MDYTIDRAVAASDQAGDPGTALQVKSRQGANSPLEQRRFLGSLKIPIEGVCVVKEGEL